MCFNSVGANTDHDSTCTSDPETSSNSSYENEVHGSVDLMDTLSPYEVERLQGIERNKRKWSQICNEMDKDCNKQQKIKKIRKNAKVIHTHK